ncbi:hypothetical protein ABC795_04905 [Blastococcus sp. HT6-30]
MADGPRNRVLEGAAAAVRAPDLEAATTVLDALVLSVFGLETA